jgi:hypothetical protein
VASRSHAEVEHGLARDGLAKMMSMLDAPGFGSVVEMVKAGITTTVHQASAQDAARAAAAPL